MGKRSRNRTPYPGANLTMKSTCDAPDICFHQINICRMPPSKTTETGGIVDGWCLTFGEMFPDSRRLNEVFARVSRCEADHNCHALSGQPKRPGHDRISMSISLREAKETQTGAVHSPARKETRQPTSAGFCVLRAISSGTAKSSGELAKGSCGSETGTQIPCVFVKMLFETCM
jgi:hypothetical protein